MTEAENVTGLSPGEKEEAQNFGLEEGNETQALKEAMQQASEAEGYEGKKEHSQLLKEVLVKQPVWISNIAMRLKAEAKQNIEATEKSEKDRENIIKTKVCKKKKLKKAAN